uniref:Ig-like domain-containing protein n=1 Tax=Anas platyrhynchos platyrhynchos TaxID=8840 RepID=A0A493SX60_ANAPP
MLKACFNFSVLNILSAATVTLFSNYYILRVLYVVNVFPGVPEAEVTWFKNKVKLSSAHHLHDGLLLIANVSLADQGLYSCKAANLRGEVTESSQLFLCLKPPRPLPQLEDFTAVLFSTGTRLPSVLTSPSGTKMAISPGSSALIGCAVDGHPTPNITWLYSGKPLSLRHHLLAAGRVLQIFNISDAPEGEFSCLAQNEAGSLIQNTSLTIQGNSDTLPDQRWDFCGQPVDRLYGYLRKLRLPVPTRRLRAYPHQQACAGALLLLETTAGQLAALQHHAL